MTCKICGVTLCQECSFEVTHEKDDEQELLDAMRKLRLAKFWQHPTRPFPFYVIDLKRMKDEDYLEWLKEEIGNDASLTDFAKTFLHLFSDKVKDTATQKKRVLSLYAVHISSAFYSDSATGWATEQP